MKDAEAKRLMLKWPERPTTLWELPADKGNWFRARPKADSSLSSAPILSCPRATHTKTQPDGLWLNLENRGLADVFAVEVCGTLANLYDKRSRYLTIASSLVVRIPKKWLEEEITLRGGKSVARHSLVGRGRAPSSDWHLPVRFLRVLYALKIEDYRQFARNFVPAGHEFFCIHSSLGGFTSQKTQEFLKTMAPRRHYLTKP